MKKHLRALAVLASGASLMAMAASENALSHQEVPGEYRLTSVNGQALPVQLGTDDGCKELVTAATLTLTADGKWTLRHDERKECPSGARTETESESGKYALTGTSVTFMDDDGKRNTGGTPDDDIDLDELDQGTVSGTSLSVKLKEGQTLVFQR